MTDACADPAATDALIDWRRVAELRDEIGADGFEDVVALFLEEVDEAIAQLTGSRGAAELEAALHFLKGSALNLGFAGFATLCARGEAQAAAGQAGSIDLTAVRDSYARSRTAFTTGLPDRFDG